MRRLRASTPPPPARSSTLTYAVVDLVRSDLVRHLAEEQGLSPRFSDALGFRLCKMRMGWLPSIHHAMVHKDALLSGVADSTRLPRRPPVRSRARQPRRRRPDDVDDRSGRLGRVRLDLAEVPNGVDRLAFACTSQPPAPIRTDGAWVYPISTTASLITALGLPRH